MTTVTTTRPVDLGQLAAEMGTPPKPLTAASDGTTTTVTVHDQTTKAVLQAAIDKHVPVRPPDPTAVQAATAAITALVVKDKLTAGTLDPTTVAAAFPTWAPGQTVKVGDLRYHDGTLVEAIQAHTTQTDWTPPVVPALWKTHRAPGAVTAWKQPVGGHDAYKLGDRVTYQGKTWESLHAANVWAPPTQWRQVSAP